MLDLVLHGSQNDGLPIVLGSGSVDIIEDCGGFRRIFMDVRYSENFLSLEVTETTQEILTKIQEASKDRQVTSFPAGL